ncbi:MAG: CsgG/HfaB family protein [Thermoanaerobaculales bacterium]|nr:CsgG/HfaB family protein [Thermoanaerobaculales bacterium]
MKRCVLFCMLGSFVFVSVVVHAQEKPRIGVLRFTCSAAGLEWFRSSVASDLQDMLISHLSGTQDFQVLNKSRTDVVLSMKDLGGSDRVSSTDHAKLMKIDNAKYLVAASISSSKTVLEGKKEDTFIAFSVAVILKETGVIVNSSTIAASAEAAAADPNLDLSQYSPRSEKSRNTSLTAAIQACTKKTAVHLSRLPLS